MPASDRRTRRSENPLEAMKFQLEACRRDARFDAMVISDDQGLCLAASGTDPACAEIAARLPLIARDIDYYEGELDAPEGRWDIAMRRFEVHGGPLYMCAVGGPGPARPLQLMRSIGGVSRILAA